MRDEQGIHTVDVINMAVFQLHVLGIRQVYRPVRAVVQVAVPYGDVLNVPGGNRNGAAAKELETRPVHLAAVFKIQYAAGAGALLRAVAHGQVLEPEIVAVPEVQDIGIPGGRQEEGFLPILAPDGQVLYVLNHQLVAVKHRLPAVELALRLPAIVQGPQKVVGPPAQADFPVGADGGKKLLHVFNRHHLQPVHARRPPESGFRELPGPGPQKQTHAHQGRHGQSPQGNGRARLPVTHNRQKPLL